MRVEDLIGMRYTAPEHLVYVIEQVQKSGMEYPAKKALVEGWARRAGADLEPYMVGEKILAMPVVEV